MDPISSNLPIRSNERLENVQKTGFQNDLIANLPAKNVVKQELSIKPEGFNESFGELMKPLGLNPNKGEQAGAVLTSPFIFLGKTGNTIMGNCQKLLKDHLS